MTPGDLVPTDPIRPSKAAEFLGLHLATIYRWADDGRLPFWRVGGRRRFSRADVQAMAKRGIPRRPDVPLPEATEAVLARRRRARDTLRRHGLGQYVQYVR